MAIQPDDERVRKFMDYIFDIYIAPGSKFPPTTWSEYSSATSRTTNACESFHSHLNGSIYAAHPNIFVLCETLIEVQCDTYSKIRDIGKCKKRSSALKKEAHVASLMTRFDLAELNRFEFIQRVGFKFLPLSKTL